MCGRMFLCILRMYMYSMCARVSVFEMHNNIFSLPVFYGDKGVDTQVTAPMAVRDVPKRPSIMEICTDTHLHTYTHTHTALTQTQHRPSLVWLRST